MDAIARYKEDERIGFDDLHSLCERELRDLLVAVNEEICHIENQLVSARARFQQTGKYTDAGWYSRASAARKINGHLSQAIQAELRKKNEERKAANVKHNERTNARSLLEAMNLILTKEQRDAVIRTAREFRLQWEDEQDG